MGLLNLFLKKSTYTNFTPDFQKTEYDNWLSFLDSGRTSKEWESLKSQNHWKFRSDDTEIFLRYQKELKSISDKYYSGMEKLQADWSVMYNLKDYIGKRATKYEFDCKRNIHLYKQMALIEKRNGEEPSKNIPAFKRLAMLYEKQEKFEEAIIVCKEACSYGMDERSRMIRMIKKAGRAPTTEELKLLE